MTLILHQSIFTDGKSKIYRTSSITNQKKRNRDCWLQKKTSSSAEVEAPKSKISCDMRRPKKSRFWPLFIRDTNLLQNIFFIIFYVFVSFPEFSICCRSIIYFLILERAQLFESMIDIPWTFGISCNVTLRLPKSFRSKQTLIRP